ncbi:hypothetical protein EDB87DRAFT_1746467 [Lactarius vividus]|nr:hypothetical protein EDB87DRAFT_1746467 [Lactarius vividus]
MEHQSGIPTQSHAGLLTTCPPPSATFSNDALNDLLRLIGSQKLSGLSEVNTLGLGAMGSSDSTLLDSAGLHFLGRNPQIQANSTSSPPATLQSSLPGPSLDVNTPHVTYSSDALGSAGQPDALTQGKYHIICHATHEDLFVAQNLTYMRIYSEFTKVSAGLTTLERAYENLVTNLKTEPTTQATTTSTYQTGPPALNSAEYPLVTLWTWHAYSKEAKARDEFQNTGSAEGEPESKVFWFLQRSDGLMVDIPTVARMRSASKKIWVTMKTNYKNLPPTWMKFTPAMQMEFYLDIETQKIGTTDYPHWYKRSMKVGKKCGLPKDEPKDEPDLEDTLQDAPNTPKHTKLTPSVAPSQQSSHSTCRSELHLQFPGDLEFDDHPPPQLSTSLPAPSVPGSSPTAPTLTLSQAPSSTTTNAPAPSLIPDTQPGSATALATSESDKSLGQSVDESITQSTNSSSLGVQLDSRSDAASTVGFFSHILPVIITITAYRDHPKSTVSPDIPPFLLLSRISSDIVTRNAPTPSPLQLRSICNLSDNGQHVNDKPTTPSTDPMLSGPDRPELKKVPAVGVTKTKNKKASAMRPGTSNTARNLFAIDYLKENTATCEEFVKVWKELDDTTRKASWYTLGL